MSKPSTCTLKIPRSTWETLTPPQQEQFFSRSIGFRRTQLGPEPAIEFWLLSRDRDDLILMLTASRAAL